MAGTDQDTGQAPAGTPDGTRFIVSDISGMEGASVQIVDILTGKTTDTTNYTLGAVKTALTNLFGPVHDPGRGHRAKVPFKS